MAEIRGIQRHRQQTIEERLDDLQRRGVLVRSGAPEAGVSAGCASAGSPGAVPG